jgi:hypothetical protein
MRGRETTRPIKLDQFGTYAIPLRHLGYLLEDIQPAVLLYGHGILINVPAPGRFAIHKCAISQKRGTAAAAKIRKDLSQAEQVFEALLDIRPADITLALRAAGERNAAFREKVSAGIGQLDPTIASEIQKLQ